MPSGVFGSGSTHAFKAPGSFRAAALGAQTGRLGAKARDSLVGLICGPYFDVATWMDATSLCRTEAACRALSRLNRGDAGAWRQRGLVAFRGLELEQGGPFDPSQREEAGEHSRSSGESTPRPRPCIDWKSQYRRFRTELLTFCEPFGGSAITTIAQRPDEESAYWRCRLCKEVLSNSHDGGAYIELEVISCPGSLSMALVDFEAEMISSVTFSPEAGAVLRERRSREAPSELDGVWAQPLSSLPVESQFRGLVALYVEQGRLAFLRRLPVDRDNEGADGARLDTTQAPGDGRAATESIETEWAAWESTGFICDLDWARSGRLQPCLGFANAGGAAYKVRVVEVSSRRPDLLNDRFCDQKPADTVVWHALS